MMSLQRARAALFNRAVATAGLSVTATPMATESWMSATQIAASAAPASFVSISPLSSTAKHLAASTATMGLRVETIDATADPNTTDVSVSPLPALSGHIFNDPSHLHLIGVAWVAPASGVAPSITLYAQRTSATCAVPVPMPVAAGASSTGKVDPDALAQFHAAVLSFVTAQVAAAAAAEQEGKQPQQRRINGEKEKATVIFIPFQKDNTGMHIAPLLALPRPAETAETMDMNVFTSMTDAWAQVYSSYMEQRAKIRGLKMPPHMLAAYHFLSGAPFVPQCAAAQTTAIDGADEAKAAEAQAAATAELSIATLMLVAHRFRPVPKSLAHLDRVPLSTVLVGSRAVRPVNFFVVDVDNRSAKSVRERISIRVTIFNPQTGKNARIELVNLKDREKLQRVATELSRTTHTISAIILQPGTEPPALMALLRAITPMCPVYILNRTAVAQYIAEAEVVKPDPFLDGFKAANPQATWAALVAAVREPRVLHRAIVAAAHHRFKQSNLSAWTMDSSVPRQKPWSLADPAEVAAPVTGSEEKDLLAIGGGDATPAGRSSGNTGAPPMVKASGFRPRGAVADNLRRWTDLIYHNPERDAREATVAAVHEKFLVIDLETTTKSAYRRKANAFTGANHIVLPGCVDYKGTVTMPAAYLGKDDEFQFPDLTDINVLVGHNIKFDLFYLWHMPALKAFLARGGRIWDTMYAEYLLTGHETRLGTGAGLDDVAAAYGGTVRKLDEVKAAWDAGKDTTEIPYDTLATYLRGDLTNTEFIYRRQLARARGQSQMCIVQERMDSLLCTTEMEYNGLKIDLAAARRQTDQLIAETAVLKKSMDGFIPPQIPWTRYREFNWGSNLQLTAIFFGGPLEFPAALSHASLRNKDMTLYSAMSSLRTTAELAYMANFLTPKVLKNFVHPYLRELGLRTTADLSESFDDAVIERRYECFFYAVDTTTTSAGAKELQSIAVYSPFMRVAFEGKLGGESAPAVSTEAAAAGGSMTTSRVQAPTAAALLERLNVWLNEQLVGAVRADSDPAAAARAGRHAILLARRGSEEVTALLAAAGFSPATFKSDEHVNTGVSLADDMPLELQATRFFKPQYFAALGLASESAAEPSAQKKPRKQSAEGKKKKTEVTQPMIMAQIRAAALTEEAAMQHVLAFEQQAESMAPLDRAQAFATRATTAAALLQKEYVQQKQEFIADPNAVVPKRAAAAPLKKLDPACSTGKASQFRAAFIPSIVLLDHPFASAPPPVRAEQLHFQRNLAAQLADYDPFAMYLPEAPPAAIELAGMLSHYVPDENEQRAIRAKFTSPETGKLQVGEPTLDFFAQKGDALAKVLLDLRQKEKLLSTYYEDKTSGMMALVHSNDSCIHHELQHNKTATGRLASSNPNCQNIPKEDKSEIRELFVSRFGDKGVCIEADYSQLEVVTLCALSHDAQMTEDLRNNVDFHCKRVTMMRPDLTYDDVLLRAKKNKEPEFVQLRQAAKIFSFQRQYGAGVKKLAESTGLAPEVIKQIIERERQVYKGTDMFYDMVTHSCHTFDPTIQTGQRNTHGDVYFKGIFPVLTGSRYTFTQSDVPFVVAPGESTTNFSPTHLKNYPVQGFAGEIVQIMLGRLYRHFVAMKNYDGRALLTNTVHDCVWVDCQEEVALQVAEDVQRIMSSAREVLNEVWPEMGCVVEFPVDVVMGKNMGHLMNVSQWKKKQEAAAASSP